MLVGAVVAGNLLASREEKRAADEPPWALAPYREGMSLREAFETLPDPGDERASIRLFADNSQAWVERWRLLDAAAKSIDCSYFILHEDIFGLSFLGHLLEKAEKGVRVRILLDGFGTSMSREVLGNGFLEELAATPNVTLRTYRPLWRRWTEALLALRPSAVVASEHDKILVADGRSSLIGGRNIAVEYFSDPARVHDAFKDLDIRMDGKAVAAALTRAFEAQLESEDDVAPGVVDAERRALLRKLYRGMDDYLRGRPVRLDASEVYDPEWLDQMQKNPGLRAALEAASPRPVAADTRILDSQTRFNSPDDPITTALSRLVRSAQESIFVQTPYVVLSDEGLRLLEDASRRGVRVTILTNSPVSSDNALSQAFFLEQWPEVLARVPTLRLFVAGEAHNLHAKAVVFDERLALVGTYNLDPVSMAFNSEVMAASWSKDVARLVNAAARSAIERGAPQVYEYRIRRDAGGRAVRDGDGEPVVEFGPDDHCSPEQRTALLAFWTVLRASKEFAGLSPIL